MTKTNSATNRAEEAVAACASVTPGVSSLRQFRILDSAFQISHVSSAGFFERMARSYCGPAMPEVHPPLRIEVTACSCEEIKDAVTDWSRWGTFHRSLNYSHWNLEGPVDDGSIFLPGEGMLFNYHRRTETLRVHVDTSRAKRCDELVFHAARNLALWRRGRRYAPMLHASAVVFEGKTWLFLGEKGSGKSTVFVDGVLRHGGQPLANDRVMLDVADGVTVWSWPSYLSYCEGTIIDYPELRRVFDTARRDGLDVISQGLYRRNYGQSCKRIVPPFLMYEVLGRQYLSSAPLGGVVLPRLDPGARMPATVDSVSRTSALRSGELRSSVFGADDPDFPCWHGEHGCATWAECAEATALAWLQAVDVPLLEITVNPVTGKDCLKNLLFH